MKAPMTAEARTDADLVIAARDQEAGAYGELFRRWYDRCFDVALNVLRDREAAADVAQDAFLTGWERLADLRTPEAFGGWILRTTRNRALNRLARERSRTLEPIDDRRDPTPAAPDPGTDPAMMAERQDQRRLLWTAVAVLGERDTSLLDLHLRHGLEPSEIAEELQITANNASQLLFRLRRKLREAIGAALLWRDGHPTCGDLAELVADTSSFDLTVASIIRQHRRNCPRCNRELSRQTDPERLFAGVPFAAAPLLLKERAVAALTQVGAPMTAPSAAVPPAVSAPAGPLHGTPARLTAIGGAAIGLGLLLTVWLWPSGPGRGGAEAGGAVATGSHPPTTASTPATTAGVTASPTSAATPTATATVVPTVLRTSGGTPAATATVVPTVLRTSGGTPAATAPVTPTPVASAPVTSTTASSRPTPSPPRSTDPGGWVPPDRRWCHQKVRRGHFVWVCCCPHAHRHRHCFVGFPPWRHYGHYGGVHHPR